MSDRRAPYQHSSGFQKRKLAQKKSADAQELMSKIPKLTDLFRKQQFEGIEGEADTGRDEEADAQAKSDEKSDAETGVHGVTSPEPDTEAKHETSADAEATSCATNEQGEEESVHYCNDLGLWADDMSKEMRDWWIEKGSKECQHIDMNEQAARPVMYDYVSRFSFLDH